MPKNPVSGATLNAYTYFSVRLADDAGHPVPVLGGDVLAIHALGGAMTYTVPALTGSFDLQTRLLTGTAPASAWLSVHLGDDTRQVQAGHDGHYALDLRDLLLSSREKGCVEHVDSRGNRARLTFVAHYEIHLPLLLHSP